MGSGIAPLPKRAGRLSADELPGRELAAPAFNDGAAERNEGLESGGIAIHATSDIACKLSSRARAAPIQSDEEPVMEKKNYYDADSLRRSLDVFEKRAGMSSEEFYAAYVEYDIARLSSVPAFHRHAWASFYRDWQRLSGNGNDFAASVARMLEPA